MSLRIDIESLPMVRKMLEACAAEISAAVGLQVRVCILQDMPDTISLQIRQAVCEEFGIEWDFIVSESRQNNITLARHMWWWFMKKFTKVPFADLAKATNRKDHSTVISGISHVNDMIDVKDFRTLDYHTKIEKRILKWVEQLA